MSEEFLRARLHPRDRERNDLKLLRHGMYEYGSLLAGTFKRVTYDQMRKSVGRIKCGTESNDSFKNITVTDCIFEGCRGFALETVDGAIIEDITISNLTMRGVVHSPIFLRLGARLRGPAGTKPGVLRRVSFSNIVSSEAVAQYPSIIAGISSAPIEDIRLDSIYLDQIGGGTAVWAELEPLERPAGYPEADMFGTLPATGLFLRHARNLQLSNIEIAIETTDARAAIWAAEVEDLDVFRLRAPKSAPAYALRNVRGFRNFGSRNIANRVKTSIEQLQF